MKYAQDYIKNMKRILDNIDVKKIEKIADILLNAWENDKHVFILGNGGSAATASHFACDLGKGTLERYYDLGEKRFHVQSLTDNVSIMTAYGNDLSYDEIFAQQLNNLVKPNDLVIVITGSGNSKNVLKAIELANENNATTLALLGFNGGKAKDMVDHHLIVPSNHYGMIEDVHLILCHLIATYLFSKKKKEI